MDGRANLLVDRGVVEALIFFLFPSFFPSTSIYLFIYLYLPAHLSMHASIFYLSIHPSIHLSIYPSIHLSIYPSMHLSIYPSSHLATMLKGVLVTSQWGKVSTSHGWAICQMWIATTARSASCTQVAVPCQIVSRLPLLDIKETSSMFEVDNITNEAILRVECRADGLAPMHFPIVRLHLSKASLTTPRKSEARLKRISGSQSLEISVLLFFAFNHHLCFHFLFHFHYFFI